MCAPPLGCRDGRRRGAALAIAVRGRCSSSSARAARRRGPAAPTRRWRSARRCSAVCTLAVALVGTGRARRPRHGAARPAWLLATGIAVGVAVRHGGAVRRRAAAARRGRRARAPSLRHVLDGLVIAAAIWFVGWVVIAAPPAFLAGAPAARLPAGAAAGGDGGGRASAWRRSWSCAARRRAAGAPRSAAAWRWSAVAGIGLTGAACARAGSVVVAASAAGWCRSACWRSRSGARRTGRAPASADTDVHAQRHGVRVPADAGDLGRGRSRTGSPTGGRTTRTPSAPASSTASPWSAGSTWRCATCGRLRRPAARTARRTSGSWRTPTR